MDTSHPTVRPFWASYFCLAYTNETIRLSGITGLEPRTPLLLFCLKTALVAALEGMPVLADYVVVCRMTDPTGIVVWIKAPLLSLSESHCVAQAGLKPMEI